VKTKYLALISVRVLPYWRYKFSPMIMYSICAVLQVIILQCYGGKVEQCKSVLMGLVGAKLCMISNIIGSEGTGTVTGVDISPHRVATCRSLVKRYKVAERVRLFNADGTTFKVYAPSRLGARVIREENGDNSDRKRQQISQEQTAKSSKPASIKPFYAPKILRFDPQLQGEEYLYDKVKDP
jgi:hypothetical protein